MISDDDLTPAALRMMEAKLAAREAAMFADEAGMPTEAAPAEAFDDLDDDGNDALTGQPVLSSWLASQPWAQDDGGEPVQLAANAAGGTASDAAPEAVIRNIPRGPGDEMLGAFGAWVQNELAPALDRVGVTIKLPEFLGGGEIRPTLKDVTVGDAGRVIEDASYGFPPIRGGNAATGGLGTLGQLKPEALELMNVVPAAVAAPKLAKGVVNAALSGPASGSMAAQRGSLLSRSALKALDDEKADLRKIAAEIRNPAIAEQAVAHMTAVSRVLPRTDTVLVRYAFPEGELSWRSGNWKSHGEKHLAAGDGLYLAKAGFPTGADFLDSLVLTPRPALERWVDAKSPERVMYVFRDVTLEKDGRKVIPSVTVDAGQKIVTNVILRPATGTWKPEGYEMRKPGK